MSIMKYTKGALLAFSLSAVAMPVWAENSKPHASMLARAYYQWCANRDLTDDQYKELRRELEEDVSPANFDEITILYARQSRYDFCQFIDQFVRGF